MKKTLITLLALAGVAAGELAITENVCIDFGKKLLVEDNIINDIYATEKYYPETGWNLQAGTEKNFDCYTTTMTDKATGETSNIQVKFGKMKGLNLLGGYSPIQGTADVLKPEKPMQDVWQLMHDVSLTEEEVNSYWCEEVTIGVAASIGDITVSNLQANSTYALSAVVTVAEVVSLIGKAAPVTMNYADGALSERAAFMTTNEGSVNIEVALGNFDVASLISGKTFTMSWIFETGDAPTSVDLSFASSLVSVVGVTSISAMAVTRYDESAAMVQAEFEDGAEMLHPVDGIPEPTTSALSLLGLAALAARRRRRK